MNQEELIRKRKIFFDAIIDALCSPPTKFDMFMKQDKLFTQPNRDTIQNGYDTGNLVIPMEIPYENFIYNVDLSIYQIGRMLRIGLLTKHDELKFLFEADDTNEFEATYLYANQPKFEFWASTVPQEKFRDDMTLWEWEFDASNLYDSFQNQEDYTLGLRHTIIRFQNLLNKTLSKISNA